MSTLRSILRGLWRFLDGLRRFLHLLVLLAIVGFIVGALRATVPFVPEKAALLVAPQGELVEQLSGDPLARALEQARGQGHAETLLWDLVDAIHAAAKDSRIKLLALDLDSLDGSNGQPTLEELARALREFRASGKKVIAYGSAYLRDQYYLAAQADEIYLDPLGYVLIDGYGRYPMFFKEALDKLNVDVNVFRVGAYKSAVEPFTRSSMSPEDREEALGYLNALWSSYQKAVGEARKLPAGGLAAYVDSLPKSALATRGATAQAALDAHLVTGLKSRREVEQRIADIVGQDDNTVFSAVSSQEYVRLVHAQSTLGRRDRTRIGVIVAVGDILEGTQPPGSVGGDSLARLIRAARTDDKIRAVVLRVDSPGGSGNASAEVYHEIKALEAAGKPVVVSMSTLAASGGYWIAAPADEIWASPATITGSIGIFAIVPTVNRALGKLGVGVDGVSTAPIIGGLRVDRPLSEEARDVIQGIIWHGYDTFVADVAAGRHKSREQVDSIGQGRVWSGVDAARLGLVDHLGSFDDAVKAAARRAKLTDYKLDFVQPELTWAQTLVQQVRVWGARALFKLGGGASPAYALVQRLDPLARQVERLSRLSQPNRLYAYCFCSAD